MIKLVVALVAGGLDSWGGYSFLAARRFIMPSVISVSSCFFIHSLWPLTMCLCMGTLILGYKNFGKGNFGRACWLFVQYALLGLGCFLSGHLDWYFYLPYVLLGGVLGGLLVRWKQQVGDFIEGFFLGSIVFLIK